MIKYIYLQNIIVKQSQYEENMKKTINVLSQGFSDDIDILSENEMDEITGGDVDCKKKYVKGHVECHKRYTEKGSHFNCSRKFTWKE